MTDSLFFNFDFFILHCAGIQFHIDPAEHLQKGTLKFDN